MPNNILIKKSSVAARVPTTADLDYGELALDYADGAVYYKTSGNVIARLNPSETDTLATVTTRGATTSNAVTIGGLTVNGNSSITGNLGVGTATPGAKFEIVAGAADVDAEQIRFGRTNNGADGLRYNSIYSLSQGGGTGRISFRIHDSVTTTSQATVMSLLGNGNVGIGTTSPGARLDIVGAGAQPNLRVTSSSWGDINNAMVIFDSGSTGDGKMLRIKNYGARNDMTMFDVVNSVGTVFAIRGDGNVGIGTTSPGYKLDVVASSNSDGFRVRQGSTSKFILNGDGVLTWGNAADYGTLTWDTGMAIVASQSSNDLKLVAGTAYVYLKNSTGNVGIGTTTPGTKLDVIGTGQLVTGTTYGVLRGAKDITDYKGVGLGYDSSGQIGVIYAESNGAASNLSFWTYNSGWGERVRIQSNGNVGIGSTSPGARLDVRTEYGLDGLRVYDRTGALAVSVNQYGTLVAANGILNNTGVYGSSGDGTALTFLQGASEKARIDSSGQLLLGTTSNLASSRRELVMVGANGAVVSLGNTTTADRFQIVSDSGENALLINKANAPMLFYTNNTERIRILSAGNVGIGTATPSQALHVSGSARITGAIIDSSNSAGTNGQVLTSTVTGTTWSSSGAGVGGTGTAGKIVKWSSASVLTDSVITESSGNIGIDTAPSQKLDVNGNIGWGTDHVLAYATLTTTATTANQIIASISATTYRTCKFIIQAVDATAGKYQSQEIMAIHNGSAVAHTEYTAITVGAAVATFDVDISGSTVRLLCTPLSVNSTVFKISMQLIKV